MDYAKLEFTFCAGQSFEGKPLTIERILRILLKNPGKEEPEMAAAL
jgi:hypothetical protein